MLGIPHPYLTADIPGVGGEIKQSLDDFVVEEVPLYPASGEGEHLYFEVETRDLAAFEMLDRLGRALEIDPGAIGLAGMKDRKAVTRQVLSVQGAAPEAVLRLDLPQLRVLWARRHRNKLRLGHLRGNRFTIRVRGVEPDRDRIGAILDVLRLRGIPNYFGPQRFGIRGEAQWIGRALVRGDEEEAVRRVLGRPSPVENNPRISAARRLFEQYRWSEARESWPGSFREERRLLDHLLRRGEDWAGACRRLGSRFRRLYLTAFQAWLFNWVLARRLEDSGGWPGRFHPGDVAWIHGRGAVFRVEDLEEAGERGERFEISPTGPLFGKKMMLPSEGLADRIEREAVRREGLTLEMFHGLASSARLSGGRRPLRVPAEELDWELEDGDLVLRFFLPSGSYATTLLRELTKREAVPPAARDAGGG